MNEVNNFSNNPLIINNIGNPFENDYSGKLKDFSENLTHFLIEKSENKPYVISISAPWGYGKTTFIDMWGQSLRNSGKLVIKYDAWRNDINDTPLISILSELNGQLNLFIKDEKFKTFIDAIKNSGIKLAYKCVPILIKLIFNICTHKFGISTTALKDLTKDFQDLSNPDIKHLSNKFNDNLEKSIDNLIETEIEEHNSKKQSVDDFKEAIRNLLTKGIMNERLFFFH